MGWLKKNIKKLGGGLVAGQFEDEKIKVDKNPELMAREQYQYYQDEFVPTERKFAGLIKSPKEIESLAGNAGISAARPTNDDELNRNIGRMGLSMSPDQAAEAKKLTDMNRTATVAGAKTRTRGGLYDLNLQREGEFVGLGRNLATTSTGAVGTAAANSLQTANANKQMKAQHQASMVSTAVTIGAIAFF